MKYLFLVAAVTVMGFASCKSTTCPAYSQKPASADDQKVMVKTTPVAATSGVNG